WDYAMRTLDRLLPLICACALVQACASNHAASPTPTANPATGLNVDSLTEQERKNLYALGYRPMNRGSEIFYCRKEVQLGSRFETTACRTGEQLKQDTELGQKITGDYQRPGFCPKNSIC